MKNGMNLLSGPFKSNPPGFISPSTFVQSWWFTCYWTTVYVAHSSSHTSTEM